MLLLFVRSTIVCVLCSIGNGLSVSPDNEANYRRFVATRFQKRFSDAKKSSSWALDGSRSKINANARNIVAQRHFVLRGNDTEFASAIERPKVLSNRKTKNKSTQSIVVESRRKLKPKSISVGKLSKPTRTTSQIQQESASAREDSRAKEKRRKKERINADRKSGRASSYPQSENDSSLSEMNESLAERVPLRVPCRTIYSNESSLSLRSLFHVPRVRAPPFCSERKQTTVGEPRREGRGQSSAVTIRAVDRGHAELVDEYENKRSMDVVGVEYVHPKGHVLSSPFAPRRADAERSTIRRKKSTADFSTNPADVELSPESNLARSVYASKKNFFTNLRKVIGSRSYRIIGDDETKENDLRVVDSTLRKKRETYESMEVQRTLAKVARGNVSGGATVESAGYNRSESKRPASRKENSTSKVLVGLRNLDAGVTTDTPWPLVPGPISCDLDFQLRPSFVAGLGEFDYVVSVQRQQNPDIPAEHACTGVIYNPRFVMIAPHCLHEFCDNYALTVTSTDDLCTIDEVIEVDYVIEHENYDAETRKNDIALIKLKSEIHKRSATFSKDNGLLGKFFYAVGFGELMWKSYPTKISKLLQKIPVRRHVLKEAAGTLDITTSNLDLTGAFRVDSCSETGR